MYILSARTQARLVKSLLWPSLLLTAGILLYLVADTIMSNRTWFTPPAPQTSDEPVK